MRNKLELALISVQNRAIMAGSRMKDRLTNKEDGDSNLVVVILLIAIAVGLCIIFRDKMKTVLENTLTSVTDQVGKFTSDKAAGGAAAGGKN